MFHDPFNEEEPFEQDETVNDKELTHLIDDLLYDVRPERYSADDKDWMDPVITRIETELGRRRVREVIHDIARRRVHNREAVATRKANRILRDINDTGQLPLGWGDGEDWKKLFVDTLHCPLSIARQRVRFGAASPQDLNQWELENARDDDKRRMAQISARAGARLVAQWALEQGVGRVEDLRQRGEPNSP